ncbi:hypothetical protein WA158_001355 [Blastocystis sp. Blastoise]
MSNSQDINSKLTDQTLRKRELLNGSSKSSLKKESELQESSSITSSLKSSRDQISSHISQIDKLATVLHTDTESIKNTNTTYSSVSSSLSRGSSLINAIDRQQQIDYYVLYISFIFFVLCVLFSFYLLFTR